MIDSLGSWDDNSGDVFDFDELHEAVANLRRARIFFIGGSPKSGTTWVQLLLNSHPEINCRGEGHLANQLAPQLDTSIRNYNDLVKQKNKIVFDRFGGFPEFQPTEANYLLYCSMAMLLLQVQRSSKKLVLGEKTPDNVRYFPFLHRMFPRARFIHVVRDGRDCATSGWFHNRRLQPGGLDRDFAGFDKYAESFADIWMLHVQSGMRFGALNADRTIGVRYEDLVSSPHATVRSVLQFLEVDSAADVVEQCVAAAKFEQLAGGRHPGEENRNSFFRRGLPNDWRRHFSPETAARFAVRAGALLTLLGYTI